MKYLLDTDTINFFYDELRQPEHTNVRGHFSRLGHEDILQVSILTIFELEYSWENSLPEKKEKIRETIEEVVNIFDIVPLNMSSASIFGKLKTLLKNSSGISSKGMKKYNIDLMIASTTASEASILVSNDKNYSKIVDLYPSLRFENWLKQIY